MRRASTRVVLPARLRVAIRAAAGKARAGPLRMRMPEAETRTVPVGAAVVPARRASMLAVPSAARSGAKGLARSAVRLRAEAVRSSRGATRPATSSVARPIARRSRSTASPSPKLIRAGREQADRLIVPVDRERVERDLLGGHVEQRGAGDPGIGAGEVVQRRR